ncbi:MAG: cytidine/deoxycytidylate deaminase family protein [Armatimonadota bacterium]
MPPDYPSPEETEDAASAPQPRPDWDDYFMQITRVVATRATCLRRTVGAILVKDRRILATGYNGPPSGLAHCETVGCYREQHGIPPGQRVELCRGIHAEQNSIIQAAIHGVKLAAPITCYSTTQPCVTCAKMLINVGVTRIVFEGSYPDELARQVLEEAGVELVRCAPEGARGPSGPQDVPAVEDA